MILNENLYTLIPLIPLAGAAINGLFWRRMKGNTSGYLACFTVLLSFALSVKAFLQLIDLPAGERVIHWTVYDWIKVGDFHAPFGFYLDPLSMTWLLIVTGVGLLIHIYSVGYMAHEEDYSKARYFSYLNLFLFSMLMLIMGDNLLLLFLGWEGVGLCSYLLISYYFDKNFCAEAGQKAFIVNRIGDVGFVLAAVWTFKTFGHVVFPDLFNAMEAPGASPGAMAITCIALLYFTGAMGKSAQLPLYVWLPDAMAGPTPVSALIHAATMVTAGIYMLCRMSPLFAMSATALQVVAVVGCSTALFAGFIGICQRDIKKVLAYSTVSQLGYMFMAIGMGAFAAGVFHVTTHAFFKALLFLGSGAVIHALHGEQDIVKMGGLKKILPGVFLVFAAGSLALSGVIPFAGFFSKDEILFSTFAKGSYVLWGLGVLAAGITAFYTFRLVYLTFAGESRIDPHVKESIHAPPKSMSFALWVLAILSVTGGLLGIPAVMGHAIGIPNIIGDFLAPVFERANTLLADGHGDAHHSAALEYGLMGLSLAVVFSGFIIAWSIYRKGLEKPNKMAAAAAGLHRLVSNKFYVDEAYETVVIMPLRTVSRFFGRFDLVVIDGIVNITGGVVSVFGVIVRIFHTGAVRSYAFWIVVGTVATTLWMLLH
jgi:NADH-quinone oxidoreductase subunit L